MFKPIKVIDLELSQQISDIDNLAHYQVVKALVRLHGTPIGYIQVPVMEGRCTANALTRTALEQHSAGILRHLVEDVLTTISDSKLRIEDLPQTPHSVYQGPFPFVTVAVCTRNRPDNLSRCLDSILGLNYSELEILVVDNAPTDDATKDLIHRAYPDVKYVCEPRPGLNWARNRAILEAQGEIIAYTDDDVVVDADWIMALTQAFVENPTVMAVTGLVVPYELETPTQLLFEEYGGFGRGFTRRWYTVNRADHEQVATRYAWAGRFGTGANMAYRRQLFGEVGYFDPALDVGTVTNGGGDLEMFFRILYAGCTLLYEPRALVRHCHRRDYETLYSQIRNNGIGFSAYLVRNALAYPSERFAIYKFWLSWLYSWQLLRLWNSLRGREAFPRDLIMAELQGYIVGLRRYTFAQDKARTIKKNFGVQRALVDAMEVPRG